VSSTGAEDGVGTKVVIGAIGVIAAITALLVVLFGARILIGGSSVDEEPSAEQTQGGTTPDGAAIDEETTDGPIPSTPDRRQVTLIARSGRQMRARSTYADLSDGDVLRMTIRRDGPSRGAIEQCVVRRRDGADSLRACGNALPVVTDDDGAADVLYQVVDTGRCGRSDRCVVVVRFPADDEIADAFIVFGDGPPELTIELEPAGPYLDGDEVLVDVGATPPGTALSVRLCGDTCADPILGAATSDGHFSATIEIDDECNRCQVLVSAGPRELASPLSIADGPGAAYSVRRLLAGLAAAIGFLAAAVLITRRTDWRPPSEAATPAFDGPWRWDDLPDDG
jgi:hypothetical protein